MVKLSRYAHEYDLGDAVALYHSLRMKPVYLKKDVYRDLRDWLVSPYCATLETSPDLIKQEINELVKYKVLVLNSEEDDRVLEYVRSKIPKPAISVCYFILSEQCNLACKYCFLGNNDAFKRKKFLLESMSIKTADKAIEFFVRQLKHSGIDAENVHPVIIFYGGEPLINFSVLDYVASRFIDMKRVEPVLKHLEMSIVTNGTLLNEEKLIRLQELGVGIGISVDGFDEKSNAMRVDKSGYSVYSRILDVLDMCKRLGVSVSFSVTLSEETISSVSNIVELVNKYGIKGLGFNIMMSSETFVLSGDYNEKAAQFIIDAFLELRKLGIYEDRMMRKVKSFLKSQVYFSDCAATSGGQIVIAPDGSVGICHGCLYNKQYFITDVYDDDFDARNNETYLEWSNLTPINRSECMNCPALGICGGGCPINAMHLRKGNNIHSIDERFCVHAKKTLEFLIKDLYRIVMER